MGIYSKGKDWYIDYYVHGKRKREKIGPSKILAQADNLRRSIVKDPLLNPFIIYTHK